MKPSVSLTVLPSVMAPHHSVWSPDLWRAVYSYQAVSLTPSLSLAHPHVMFLSAAAEPSHASSSSRVTSASYEPFFAHALACASIIWPPEAAVHEPIKKKKEGKKWKASVITACTKLQWLQSYSPEIKSTLKTAALIYHFIRNTRGYINLPYISQGF